MDINLLVKITSRTWSLEILKLMDKGVPGRQAPLLAATDAGRTAFSQSLHHLINLGLLERNPGHGHPLRPEFRLTDTGKTAAALAHTILKTTPAEPQGQLLRLSWTIPILAVTRRPQYFGQIRNSLELITDRALSKSLLQLQDNEWIRREVDTDSRPPRPLYRAINAGADIGAALNLGP